MTGATVARPVQRGGGHLRETDVLVVGGGPVGLAAAIHARAAGYDVVVLDRRTAPVDKACGEGLMPGALAAVQRLGVDPAGHDLAGISYRAGRRHADHRFAGALGRGVRRTTLHGALHERALAAGATILHDAVTSVLAEPDAVVAGGVRARWLVACDGLHSAVRRLAGLDAPPGRAPGRYGLRRHYRVRAWTDLVEVHWAPGAEAYVTPVADDVVGVAVLGPRGAGLDGTIADLPELADRLRGAVPLGPVRGAGPLRQRSTGRTAGRVRLAGDASGYVDALTGEGLRVGLAQAESAIRHLDDARAYEREWVRVTRDYRLLTSGLVAWATSPLRSAIVPVAAASPRLYGAVVDRLAR